MDNDDRRLYFTFPGGARRAVTLSFDDGTVHDRRLVAAFGAHGLKATFNLVPGRFGRDGVVPRGEVASLYAGHEIASHGWKHLNLDRLDHWRRLDEIRDGRAALEDLLGRPVRGFASPYGAHGDAAVDAMREAGVAYARTAAETRSASWPVPDFLRWTQSAHERHVLPLVEGAAGRDGWGGTLSVLSVWGHGYEFENRWDDLERLCAALGGREGVWYATNIEIVDYWNACRAVASTLDGFVVRNMSATTVHASFGPDHGRGDGAVAVALRPGEALDLRTLAPPKAADPVSRILLGTEPASASAPSGTGSGSGRAPSPRRGPVLLWPGFRERAVTFSWDDGMRNDRRLAALLSAHGLRGTFNLNSGKLSPYGAPPDAWNVRASEVPALYAEHEIAVHGRRHETWNVALPGAAALDVARDRLALEALAGRPVEGSAYPCGEHSKGPAADAALRAAGIVHARVVERRADFSVPEDFLDWHPTVHHASPDAEALADRFLAGAEPDGPGPALFYVWGHSFEFGSEDDWARFEALCARFDGRDDVWRATNVEICRYVLAFRALRATLDGSRAENPTAVPLWLDLGGRRVVLAPGAAVV